MVITGNANDNDIKDVNDAGINQIIYKPFKISDLLERVKDILTEKEQVINFT
jgi:DNA-binding response OmpR family regulator